MCKGVESHPQKSYTKVDTHVLVWNYSQGVERKASFFFLSDHEPPEGDPSQNRLKTYWPGLAVQPFGNANKTMVLWNPGRHQ